MSLWFDSQQQQQFLRITFHPSPDRYWPPSVLREQALPADLMPGVGTIAVLSDPQGAVFALYQPSPR